MIEKIQDMTLFVFSDCLNLILTLADYKRPADFYV